MYNILEYLKIKNNYLKKYFKRINYIFFIQVYLIFIFSDVLQNVCKFLRNGSKDG